MHGLVQVFHLAFTHFFWSLSSHSTSISHPPRLYRRWKKVLSQNPSNVEALVSLSYVDTELHHYAEALDSLHSALQVNQHHQDALYRAGHLHFRNKEYKQASELLTRLLNLAPHHSDAAALLRSSNKLMPQNSS